MPNWKKVIVSGSDAILNEVTASSGLDTTDVTIDDWGSISASLASIEAGGASQTLQDVTDNGSTTTNDIEVNLINIGSGGDGSTTIVGRDSLQNLTSGDSNTSLGFGALKYNSVGDGNTAIGKSALEANLSGSDNIAIGNLALQDIESGNYNVALGAYAFKFLLSDYGSGVTDDRNTAVGHQAFENLLGGVDNVAIGYKSPLSNGNPGLGYDQGPTTASGSIYIGSQVKSSWAGETTPFQVTNNEIVIGTLAIGNGSNTVTIGNSSVTNNYFSGNISGSDITIDGWGSVSASLATLDSLTLQDVTDNGSTTTNNITIDSTGDARLVLDRAANANDSEIEFKTSGATNWTIGTGQVGNDNEFTIKGGSSNFVRINESGQADFLSAVTSSDVTIDDWGSISASLASIESTGASQNLQQVTNNGATTTNAITVPELTLTGSLEISRGNGNKSSNIAIGSLALRDNTTGVVNTALGDGALKLNTTGRYNTAIGVNALGAGEDARYNVAVGEGALFYNDSGEDNVAIGVNAGWLTANGQPNLYPSESIFIGFEARSAYNANKNMIVIGHGAVGRNDNTVVIGNSRTTDNYFFGNVSGSDVIIDDWGSVSASLASLNSEANSVTLQEVLNASNGTATASGSIYLTSSAASLDFEYTVLHAGTVVAEGGSGLFSTPNTSAPSSHFTTALTMGSPHSASVASSLKSNTGFSTDYRGQKRQLFPSDYVSAASQSMYVEYAEGANQNDNGTAYFQVDLDTKSPEYLLPLTASQLYVRDSPSNATPTLVVESELAITGSGGVGNSGALQFGTLTSQYSDTQIINSPANPAIGQFSLATHMGVKYDYVVYLGARDGGSNITHRAGTFTATWDEAGNISYSETTTTDNQSGVGIPSTSGFILSAQTGVGSTCEVRASNTTGYVATIVFHRIEFKAPY